MNLLAKLAGASVALALTMGASAAAAAIITATYSGTVSGNGPIQSDGSYQTGGAFDFTHEFGDLISLDQQAFTAVFKFDTALGVIDTSIPGFVQYSGPFLSADLTIENQDYSFYSTTAGAALVATDGTDTARADFVEAASGDGTALRFLQGFIYNPTLPLDLAGPFSGGYSVSAPLDPLHQNQGEFLIEELDPNFVPDPLVDFDPQAYLHLAHGYLVADELTVTSTVPEPASWALMLAGLGGLGAAMRASRDRRAPV